MDEQTQQILELFAQPTFWVKDGLVEWRNSAARALIGAHAELATLFENDDRLFSRWDQTGLLQVGLLLDGAVYDASVRRIGGGMLFVASPSGHGGLLPLGVIVNASTSLRRPLQTMMQAAGILFEQLDGKQPETAEAAAALNRSIYRFVRICGQLSDGGSLLLHRRRAQKRPADLSRFLEQLIGEVRPLVQGAGITLDYLPAGVPLRGDLDLALLERALYNLLSNAIAYTDPGGRITLEAQRQGRTAVLTMTDSGSGIPPEVMASLFVRSEQSVPSDPRGGLGLGLPMVREIVRLHGGELTVGTAPGGSGARVTFTLSLESGPLELRSRAVSYDYCGKLHHGLVELSDVLADRVYDPTEVE